MIMTSTVKVHMNLCSYVTTIEVSAREDGTYSLKIDSPCEKVRKYAEGFDSLDMMDIMEWASSRIHTRMSEANVGLHCSVPTGVINAARLEAGLVARSAAKQAKGNSWEFVFDEGRK